MLHGLRLPCQLRRSAVLLPSLRGAWRTADAQEALRAGGSLPSMPRNVRPNPCGIRRNAWQRSHVQLRLPQRRRRTSSPGQLRGLP
ncbi:Uncharacterised protein [Chlamydia trachomatis]|nr:Uncharacterised protein [Chlamydia trachomatis]